jgi:putative tryptophan/tyrosine transport system substrate-binding protein
MLPPGAGMRRRDFIAMFGGAAAAPGVLGLNAAHAQPGTMPVIGFLSSETPDVMTARLAAYRKGLGEAGYTEGGNVTIEYRWARDRYDRLPELANDLVRRKVSVIVTNAPAVPPAKASTTTIPIVFFSGLDPVKAGFVASLNRPGGNLTGVGLLNSELVPKRVELLRELLPAAKLATLLVNPGNPNTETVKQDSAAAAQAVGLRLEIVTVGAQRDFDGVFANLMQMRPDVLLLAPDVLFTTQSPQLAALAIRHKLPAIYQYREFVTAGGLMSYSGSIAEAYRQIGVYSGRVLKGEKPADLPVQQLTKVELIINLRTAKAIGITIPQTLLARADEVIE